MKKTITEILEERRKIWKSNEIIKRLYCRWYEAIERSLRPGITLELGGGSGNLKDLSPDVISSDIVYVPWLDAVLDAHELPFKNESLNNILLFDVLHHLIEPVRFFSEAERVLRPGGRIVMVEPYVSPASFFIYQFLHHEGMDRKIDPFKMVGWRRRKDPFEGNQAIPTLMFEKYKWRFTSSFRRLKIVIKKRIDFFIYPLSGGFHNPSFCPLFLYPVLTYLERLFRPLNRFLAFRIFLVLEKG